MADVFISYAQGDRDWVKALAAALDNEGLSVWWDLKVLPGDEFGDIVVREIAASKCVVVVWSENSVGSDWVYGEADEARRAKKLIPVLKDRVQPPTAFRRIHTADLRSWNGKQPHFEVERLIEGIRARLHNAVPDEAPIDLSPTVQEIAQIPIQTKPAAENNGPEPVARSGENGFHASNLLGVFIAFIALFLLTVVVGAMVFGKHY